VGPQQHAPVVSAFFVPQAQVAVEQALQRHLDSIVDMVSPVSSKLHVAAPSLVLTRSTANLTGARSIFSI
jgi:hypothetical protein